MNEDYHQRLSRYSRQPFHRWYLRRAWAAGLEQLERLGRRPLSGPTPRVLLCGCGAKQTADAFVDFVRARKPSASITIIDLAAPELARGEHRQLAQADAAALPFRDAAFELIETDFLLQFLPGAARRAVFREWRRLLHPREGGLMTRDYAPDSGVERRLDDLRVRWLSRSLGAKLYPMAESALLADLADAGLRVDLAAPRAPLLPVALPLVKLIAAVADPA